MFSIRRSRGSGRHALAHLALLLAACTAVALLSLSVLGGDRVQANPPNPPHGDGVHPGGGNGGLDNSGHGLHPNPPPPPPPDNPPPDNPPPDNPPPHDPPPDNEPTSTGDGGGSTSPGSTGSDSAAAGVSATQQAGEPPRDGAGRQRDRQPHTNPSASLTTRRTRPDVKAPAVVQSAPTVAVGSQRESQPLDLCRSAALSNRNRSLRREPGAGRRPCAGGAALPR